MKKALTLLMVLCFPMLLWSQQSEDCKPYVVLGPYQKNTSLRIDLMSQMRVEFRSNYKKRTGCPATGIDFINEVRSFGEIAANDKRVEIIAFEKRKFEDKGIEEVVVLNLIKGPDSAALYSLWAHFVDISTMEIRDEFEIRFTDEQIGKTELIEDKIQDGIYSNVYSYASHKPEELDFNGEFNILITTDRAINACYGSEKSSAERIMKIVDNVFGDNVICKPDKKYSNPPERAQDARKRGKDFGVDLVVWTDIVNKCGTEPKLEVHATFVNKPSNDKYLSKYFSNGKPESLISVKDFFKKEVARAVYWTIYEKEKLKRNSTQKRIKVLKELDRIVSKGANPEEHSEINFLLGKNTFSPDMELEQFNACKIYFSKSFADEESMIPRKREWIEMLMALKNKPNLKGYVSDPLRSNGKSYLRSFSAMSNSNSPKKNIPEEYYVFCIDLAEQIGVKDSYVTDGIIKKGASKYTSVTMMTAMLSYYDSTQKPSAAKDVAYQLISKFPNQYEGYKYLMRIYKNESYQDSIIRYAELTKKYAPKDFDAHKNLAEQFLIKDNRKRCETNYVRAIRINPTYKDKKIESYLGYGSNESFASKKKKKVKREKPTLVVKNDCPKSTFSIKDRGQSMEDIVSSLNNFNRQLGTRVILKERTMGKIWLDVGDGYITHEIKSGWGLSTHSRTLYNKKGYYHLFNKDPDFDVNGLAKLNGLQNPNKVCEGQIILIKDGCPSVTRSTSKVMTLDEASRELGIPYDVLRRYNGEVNSSCKKSVWIFPPETLLSAK